jgi:hypothetical protein
MTIEHYYRSYYAEASFERRELFRLLREQYPVQRVLYPASSIHLAASLVFPEVVYVDSFAQVARFFEQQEEIRAFLARQQEYAQAASYEFLPLDYTRPLPLVPASFDLLISQYGGLISKPCKPYLRPGGLLLANDCDGDARAAVCDADYELLGAVLRRAGRFQLVGSRLEEFAATLAAGAPPLGLLAVGDEIDSYVFRRVS